MPKRSSKRQKDLQQLARDVPDSILPDVELQSEPKPDDKPDDGKNPAAVALGRLGGKKGGPARAKKLSKKRRSEIAKMAAAVRWKNHSSSDDDN